MSRRPPRWALEIVETLVMTLVVFIVIQNFVAQPFKVEQQSMERTLEPDQFVLVDKLTPRWDPYKRGDVVVLHPPEGWETPDGSPFIKRVIGVPGDRIEIRDDGLVYVNGTALDETGYTYRDDADQNEATTPLDGQSSWVLGPDEVFVMGDHRQESSDSRAFGPIKTSAIIGRAFLRYWPVAAIGILPTPAYP